MSVRCEFVTSPLHFPQYTHKQLHNTSTSQNMLCCSHYIQNVHVLWYIHVTHMYTAPDTTRYSLCKVYPGPDKQQGPCPLHSQTYTHTHMCTQSQLIMMHHFVSWVLVKKNAPISKESKQILTNVRSSHYLLMYSLIFTCMTFCSFI